MRESSMQRVIMALSAAARDGSVAVTMLVPM
jgi:hypothetical protein